MNKKIRGKLKKVIKLKNKNKLDMFNDKFRVGLYWHLFHKFRGQIKEEIWSQIKDQHGIIYFNRQQHGEKIKEELNE